MYAKTKVLFKFGRLEIVCVEMRPKKPLTVCGNEAKKATV